MLWANRHKVLVVMQQPRGAAAAQAVARFTCAVYVHSDVCAADALLRKQPRGSAAGMQA